MKTKARASADRGILPQSLLSGSRAVRDVYPRGVKSVGTRSRDPKIDSAHPRTAIKASHGVGKTFTPGARGAVVANALQPRPCTDHRAYLPPGQTQLWAEIHNVAVAPKFSFPEINASQANTAAATITSLWALRPIGREFSRLPRQTSANHSRQGTWSRVRRLGRDRRHNGGWASPYRDGRQPNPPGGRVLDAFGRLRSSGTVFTIDAFDSPTSTISRSSSSSKWIRPKAVRWIRIQYPHLVTRRWVYDQFKVWWHGDERTSPSWMARVRGQFPDQAQNALIKLPGSNGP